MGKILRCNDLMPGCTFEARSDSEEEVLAQAADHVKTAHDMKVIPEGVMNRLRGAIHDEDQARGQSAGRSRS